MEIEMDEKTCLITGGNSGIGKAAAVQLARRNCRVIIACRNSERGKKAAEEISAEAGCGSIEMVKTDMSSRESVRKAAEIILNEYDHLDVLIHNAADFDISRKAPQYSIENIESVWATNHIGPVVLTDALLPLIKNSREGRIITVASKGLLLHPFLRVNTDDPELRSGGYSVEKAYYQSKLAQVMYTYWLAEKLENEITVNCIRVTNVKVDLSRYPDISEFMKTLYKMKSRSSITPEEMAGAYTGLALESRFSGISGKYYDENLKAVKSSGYSRKKENIRLLMNKTYEFIL